MRMASKISFPCVPGARVDADLWWDDLTITIAMLILFPISVLSNILNKLGIGKDVRDQRSLRKPDLGDPTPNTWLWRVKRKLTRFVLRRSGLYPLPI